MGAEANSHTGGGLQVTSQTGHGVLGWSFRWRIKSSVRLDKVLREWVQVDTVEVWGKK